MNFPQQEQTLPPLPPRSESARLDSIIAKLKASGQAELLVEHLQTAHAYLLGAMPNECAVNLDLALKAAVHLSDDDLKRDVVETVGIIASGLEGVRVPRPAHLAGHPSWRLPDHELPSTAHGLTEFFQGDCMNFGTFYPVQHVVTVFPSWERALAGRKSLHEAGLQAGDVLAVPGSEFAAFLREGRRKSGPFARLVAECSRLLDTEVTLTDHYAEWGLRQAGFLFAYARTEADRQTIPELLKPLEPIAMHGFLVGGIQHLI